MVRLPSKPVASTVPPPTLPVTVIESATSLSAHGLAVLTRFPRIVPVAFARSIADGVPSAGVTRVGEVAKTSAPLPVSLVMTAARLADDGVTNQASCAAESVRSAARAGIGSRIKLHHSAKITGALKAFFMGVKCQKFRQPA